MASDSLKYLYQQLSILAEKGNSWYTPFLPFLPAIVTIILFVVGYWVNQQREIAKAVDILEDWEEYFYTSGKEFIKKARLQLDEIVKLYKQTDALVSKKVEYRSLATFNTENFEKIPHTDLYKIFVNGKRGAIEEKQLSLSECYDSFINIKTCKVCLEKAFLTYDKSAGEIRDEWNKALRSLVRFKDELISAAVASADNYNHTLDQLTIIINDWLQTGKTDLHFTKTNLLEPLRIWSRENAGTWQAMQILGYIADCDYQRDMFFSEQAFLGELAKYYEEKLKDGIESFEKTIIKLEAFPNIERPALVDVFMNKKGSASQRLLDRTDFI